MYTRTQTEKERKKAEKWRRGLFAVPGFQSRQISPGVVLVRDIREQQWKRERANESEGSRVIRNLSTRDKNVLSYV
jgi:CRISPR/Cas system-associated protein endoribonuclease Cas2